MNHEDGADVTDLQQQMPFALHATDSLLWTVDLETETLEVGHGPFESLLGISAEDVECVEPFFESVVHPDDLARVKERFGAVSRGEAEQVRIPFRTHPEHGQIQWFESHAKRTAVGDRPILTGITVEITEHKRREQDLKTANERLEEFTSILSHDIRDPLAVAVGKLTLAQEESGDAYIDDAIQALEHVESLIEELRSAVKRGGPIMREAVIQQDEVGLEAVAERAWENVVTDGQRLAVETTRRVQADRDRLQQLFENLFRNAVEHGESGVTVTVDELDSVPGFYVADDGPGLPADTDDIFEAGYSTTDEGTGLGLHIVKEITSAHGWEIEATDSGEAGARFEIRGLSFVGD